MTATKKATSKYTPTMEAAIRAAAVANGGSLNLAAAAKLAETPEFVKAEITARGIAAKCRTMNPIVPYVKVERTSKDGSAIAKKDDLVAEIADALGVNAKAISSLAKAEKAALRAVLEAVKAETDAEAELVGAE